MSCKREGNTALRYGPVDRATKRQPGECGCLVTASGGEGMRAREAQVKSIPRRMVRSAHMRAQSSDQEKSPKEVAAVAFPRIGGGSNAKG